MDKRLLLILLFCTRVIGDVHAQWTEKDSLWLKDILSGKEQLRLNPETMKAIEEGYFLDTDKPAFEPLSVPGELPLMRYFPDIASPDTSLEWVDFKVIPPSVLMRYGLDSEFEKELQSFYISEAERENLKRLLPGALTFSAEDIMRTIFWKSHRAKVRNRKKATAWKTY